MGKMIYKKVLVILSVITFLTTASINAEKAETTLDGFETLVAEWVDLRAQISSEKRDWETKKGNLEEEIKLLENEKAFLERETNSMEALTTSGQKERVDLLKKRDELTDTLNQLEPILDRVEAKIRKWKAYIPQSLATPFNKGFSKLPSGLKGSSKMPVFRRMELVIALYTQLETLQHNFHVTKEMLPGQNKTKLEMDVLYLGLAGAFAVSRDNKWALIGSLAPDGWVWQPNPKLGVEIRKALAIYMKEQPAEFVHLPLKVN